MLCGLVTSNLFAAVSLPFPKWVLHYFGNIPSTQHDTSRNTPPPNRARTPHLLVLASQMAVLFFKKQFTSHWRCFRSIQSRETHMHVRTLTIYMSSLFINGQVVLCRSSVTRWNVLPLPGFCLLSGVPSFRRLPLYKWPAAVSVPANVMLRSLQVPISPSDLWAQTQYNRYSQKEMRVKRRNCLFHLWSSVKTKAAHTCSCYDEVHVWSGLLLSGLLLFDTI